MDGRSSQGENMSGKRVTKQARSLSGSCSNDSFIQPRINGAKARLLAFIERHADEYEDVELYKHDLLFLVYRARRM